MSGLLASAFLVLNGRGDSCQLMINLSIAFTREEDELDLVFFSKKMFKTHRMFPPLFLHFFEIIFVYRQNKKAIDSK